MATASEVQAKVAKYLTNMDRLDAIVNGPASGAESLVDLDDGVQVKTLARLVSEGQISVGDASDFADRAETAQTAAEDAAAGLTAALSDLTTLKNTTVPGLRSDVDALIADLTAEISNRGSAVTTEATTRAAADIALDARLDTAESTLTDHGDRLNDAEAGLTAAAAAIAAAVIVDSDRPGDSDFTRLFSSTPTGDPTGRPDLTFGHVVVDDDLGSVLKIGGADISGSDYVDVAPKVAYALLSGHVYRLRVQIKRFSDGTDPGNPGPTIQVRAQNLSKTKTSVSNVAIGSDHNPVVIDGPVIIDVLISRSGGLGADYQVPSTTRYFTPVIRFYDNSQYSLLSMVHWEDVTDRFAGGVDLSGALTAISTEATRAQAAEATNAEDIITEATRAQAAEAANAEDIAAAVVKISDETSRAIQQDRRSLRLRFNRAKGEAVEKKVTSDGRVLQQTLGNGVVQGPARKRFNRTKSDPAVIMTDQHGRVISRYNSRGTQVLPAYACFNRAKGEPSIFFLSAGKRILSLGADGNPVSTTLNPAQEVTVDPVGGTIKVRQRQGDANSRTYNEHVIVYSDDDTKNVQVWRSDTVNHVNRNLDGSYTFVRELWEPGRQFDVAVQVSGTYDFSGGLPHGNEIMVDAHLLIDGSPVSLSVAATYTSDNIVFAERSTIYKGGADIGTRWPADLTGRGLLDLYKLFEFSPGGNLSLSGYAKALTSGDTWVFYYLGIVPWLRLADDDTVISDQGLRSMKNADGMRLYNWSIEDMSSSGAADLFSQDDRVTLTGDGYVLTVSADAGWTEPSRNMRVWITDPYNKPYFNRRGRNKWDTDGSWNTALSYNAHVAAPVTVTGNYYFDRTQIKVTIDS